MCADLERVSHNASANSTSLCGRALSANVRRLHNALNLLLSDLEREQFIHCLNVYHAKRNVFDLVQTLKVILNTQNKRQLLPKLRLVIPRSDQLLFDQYTSEGLYLKTDPLSRNDNAESFADESDSTLQAYVSYIHEHPFTAGCPTVSMAPLLCEDIFGDVHKVSLVRSRSQEGLGFSIRGGSDHGAGIYVSLVEPGSAADREGLRVGDQIVSANEVIFDNVTHTEAVKVLKGCKKLTMSVCSTGPSQGGCITNHMYSWVDPHGRAVSPPPDSQEGNQRQVYSMEERMVTINMDHGCSLGLMIRGGIEYGLGIYITGVDPGSAADVCALKVGDQILEVNGRSFVAISHDEAVDILKTGYHLLMKVRDVGRLPHVRTIVDDTRWICSQAIAETSATANSSAVPNPTASADVPESMSSRPSSARATPVLGKTAVYKGVGPPGVQVSLEHQASMLLTQQERQTMTYYLQEYQDKHIGVEPLAMALFELFNTHAKLSMLTEVRSLVSPHDLELYDRLVLNREREALQPWQGSLGVVHPQSHLSHASPMIHDVEHTHLQMNDRAAGGWKEEHNTNLFQNIAMNEKKAPTASPPSFRAAPLQDLSRHTNEKDFSQKPSARLIQADSSLIFSGQTRLTQDCPHQNLKAFAITPQPPTTLAHYTCVGARHHTALNALIHTCQSTPQLFDSEHHNQPHFIQHIHDHAAHQIRPSSGFLHHWDSSIFAKPEASIKLSSRSSSYEKGPVLSKSAPSSKAPSPVPCPHPSPRPSPCPSPCPALITTAAPAHTSDQSCLPGLTQKVIVTCMNRQPADSRPQQREATLSQLSDSGQTLSEDSGVDIAEAGGLSKDGSPKPSKSLQCHFQQPGTHGLPPGTTRQTSSPIPASPSILIRVLKSANTLGIAIEGGANTRQPLPRIVTIQKGGSAHKCGQLKVGHIILEVNGISLRGWEHKDAARLIAEAFKTKERDHVDFLVV